MSLLPNNLSLRDEEILSEKLEKRGGILALAMYADELL
jgi:hypothetical protein